MSLSDDRDIAFCDFKPCKRKCQRKQKLETGDAVFMFPEDYDWKNCKYYWKEEKMSIEEDIMKHINKCVQCCEELHYTIQIGDQGIPICYNPGCPNFGLLQCGTNFIPKEGVNRNIPKKDVTKEAK